MLISNHQSSIVTRD